MSGPTSQSRILLAAAWLGALVASPARAAEVIEPIPIGIVASFFQDAPHQKQGVLVEPFQALIKAQTGLPSAVHFSDHFVRLAQDLTDGKVKFGVFQGVEFAWARERYPDLKPLLILVNQHPFQQARLLVRTESPAKDFADLQGKKLAMARSTRMHQRLYVGRACKQSGGCDPDRFFGQFIRPANAEDGLDDLVDGVHDAVVVDQVTWEGYERRKPVRAKRLKVLQSSEIFPATAVAYRPGQVSPERLRQFEDGLLQANKNIFGRQLLSLWHLSGFEAVPPDYDRTLGQIVKSYPAPATVSEPSPAGERTK